MLALQGEKRALAERVLEGTDAGTKLTNDDLVGLLERGYAEARERRSTPPKRVKQGIEARSSTA